MGLDFKNFNGSIDVHCHLFNKNVLSWRLLIDFIQARTNIPLYRSDNSANTQSSFFGGLARVYNFIKIGMQPSSEDVYKILMKSEKNYAVVPLMFDLDYCMKGAPLNRNYSIETEIMDTYKRILEEDREFLVQMDQTYAVSSNGKQEDSPKELISIIDSLLADENKNLFHSARDPFIDQQQQLVALKMKYPNIVFPFYAVDPRRESNYQMKDGVYDLSPILKLLIINGGHFYGIKLYTPNGYSPTDPVLMVLYEYCEKHSIPITAHCSGGGFASFAKAIEIRGHIYRGNIVEEYNGKMTFKHYKLTDKQRVSEKAQMLNHPLIWEKVLQRFPKLKLNLAHFGTTEGSEQWSEHIVRLMAIYPNLYTDFSCVSDYNTLENMYRVYYSKVDTSIKSKFLYGSDFYLNMLFTDSMKEYMENFKRVFKPSEYKEISMINPKRFLSSQNLL